MLWLPHEISWIKEIDMPLKEKGKKILAAIKKHYGYKKGEQVFYASKNSGTIIEVEKKSKTKYQRSR